MGYLGWRFVEKQALYIFLYIYWDHEGWRYIGLIYTFYSIFPPRVPGLLFCEEHWFSAVGVTEGTTQNDNSPSSSFSLILSSALPSSKFSRNPSSRWTRKVAVYSSCYSARSLFFSLTRAKAKDGWSQVACMHGRFSRNASVTYHIDEEDEENEERKRVLYLLVKFCMQFLGGVVREFAGYRWVTRG